MFFTVARSFLFKLDAEKAHDKTMTILRKTQNTPLDLFYRQGLANKPVELWGLQFPNALGLAAGLDKNGECIDAFAAMGFGFIEVGTVTPRPQPGNDKPRLFRLPKSNAIINRMGFNNHGVDQLVENVIKAKYSGILGINIGKNKDTPEEQALDDYLICMDKVYQYASYITVNISSPNTPGLRNLQYGEALDNLLSGLKSRQAELAAKHNKKVPLVVKVAPDLTDDEIKQISKSFLAAEIDGVIATNTTLDRESVKGQQHAEQAGGLSGSVLTEKSQKVAEQFIQELGNKIPVIGVGGIDGPEAAKQRLVAGAPLIQLYSAFIYQGPDLIRRIVQSL